MCLTDPTRATAEQLEVPAPPEAPEPAPSASSTPPEMRAIIELHDRAQAEGWALRLIHDPPKVRRV